MTNVCLRQHTHSVSLQKLHKYSLHILRPNLCDGKIHLKLLEENHLPHLRYMCFASYSDCLFTMPKTNCGNFSSRFSNTFGFRYSLTLRNPALLRCLDTSFTIFFKLCNSLVISSDMVLFLVYLDHRRFKRYIIVHTMYM